MTKREYEEVERMSIEEVEKLWNTTNIRSMTKSEGAIEMKNKCIQALEKGYRKPWDETIYLKIIYMKMNVIEAKKESASQGNRSVLEKEVKIISGLFNEMEVTCPFLPKIQMKRKLELRGDFEILLFFFDFNTNNNNNNNNNNNASDFIKVLMEHKKMRLTLETIENKFIETIRSMAVNALLIDRLKQFEALIPGDEDFKHFHMSLLNVITSLLLELGIKLRQNEKFSQIVTEAINFNAKSLRIGVNVEGYYEFIKLARLQEGPASESDFTEAVQVCLQALKGKEGKREDLKGKLSILKLILNESNADKKNKNKNRFDVSILLQLMRELFNDFDLKFGGNVLFEEILEIIHSNGNSSKEKGREVIPSIEKILLHYRDVIISDQQIQRVIQDKLLRLAERSEPKLSEGLLEMSLSIAEGHDRIKLRLASCYLKLDKLDKVTEIMSSNSNTNSQEWLVVKLESALRSLGDFTVHTILTESKQFFAPEQLLSIFNRLKDRLQPEMKLTLLRLVLEKLPSRAQHEDNTMKIDVLRGIISIVYDGILEAGLEQFREYLEEMLSELKLVELNENQMTWTYQICWNLGVIHIKAEDFINAQFGFKWAYLVSERKNKTDTTEHFEEMAFKAGFYYLSAVMCEMTEDVVEDVSVKEEDLVILSECKRILSSSTVKEISEQFKLPFTLLEVEILLNHRKWTELKAIVTECDERTLPFESVAEILLRAPASLCCPLDIQMIILKRLTENEFDKNFAKNPDRFIYLFRALIQCSLLQSQEDVSYFTTAIEIIKKSFGGYPMEEVIWFCGTAYEMARRSVELFTDWPAAERWIEISLNLLYLIPDGEPELKRSLETSIKNLFEKIVDRP